MKVFISWSGKFSQECAELLSNWIKCTLQASEPWISSKDIDKGTLWFNEISDQLKDTKVGIVCLTKKNKEKPWILFESGALAKGISSNKVCTFLVDLKPTDINNPLAQFNHTVPDKDGMKALLSTINNELGDSALEKSVLDQVFNTYWPSFKEDFKRIVDTGPSEDIDEPTRSENEILEEILTTTRTMDKRIRSLEGQGIKKPSSSYFELTTPTNHNDDSDYVRHLLDVGISPSEIAELLESKNKHVIHDFASNKSVMKNKKQS